MSFSKSIHIKNCGKVKKKIEISPYKQNFFHNIDDMVVFGRMKSGMAGLTGRCEGI